jgi:uncharacterized protein YndB with AHSA1/START domain
METETKTFEMHLTRTFDAPVERVWHAWSDADQVMQWWGPHYFTSPICKMDFRVGGTTLVCMRTPDGQDMFNTWSYQQIVPMERIEFIHNFSDGEGNKLDPAAMGMPASIPFDVPHVITFKSLGGNKTELSVIEYGYTSPEIVEMSRQGMAECLEKMAASFK